TCALPISRPGGCDRRGDPGASGPRQHSRSTGCGGAPSTGRGGALRRIAATLAAAALVLTGCGRSAQDEAASTVRDYLNAFVDGDGAKACSLMASATRRAFVTKIR